MFFRCRFLIGRWVTGMSGHFLDVLESNGEFIPIQKVHVEDGQGLIIVTKFLST